MQTLYRYYVINDYTITVARKGHSVGVAICSPNDNFCKKIGRELAKSRMFHYTDYKNMRMALIEYLLDRENESLVPEKLKKEIIEETAYMIESRKDFLDIQTRLHNHRIFSELN